MQTKNIFGSVILVMVLLVMIIMPAFAQAAPIGGPPGAVQSEAAQEAAPAILLTPEMLGGIAGIVFSLFFAYIPRLNVKFAELTPEAKRLIMLGVLLATSGAIYGLNCGGIISTGVTCDRAGIIQLGSIFLYAVVLNQSTYGLTPVPAAVKVEAAESKKTSEALAQEKVQEKALDEHDVQSYG